MKTYVFPGQGSQKRGMGKSLFDDFKDLMAKADEILGYSIKELCLENEQERLNQTRYTQPALYVVNVLTYLRNIEERNIKPDYLAGHSLGEYNALFASGVFDFETGLRLVKKRGELMSLVSGGGMAAVIGLKEDQVKEILRENDLQSIDIANVNSPTQIVISGLKPQIECAKPAFEAAKAQMYIPLKVSGAFHSRYMKDIKNKYETFLDSFELLGPTIPVIANVNAQPYGSGEIKKNLVDQIDHPVRWTESIQYLIDLGDMEFEEMGPGTVLTNLIKAIKENTPSRMIEKDKVGKVSTDQPSDQKGVIHNNINPGAVDGTSRSGSKVDRFHEINAFSLGDEEFKKDYKLKYAYVSGSMYRGIASEELVIRMGKAGFLGYFGTGGLSLKRIEEAIQAIRKELKNDHAFGMNLLFNPNNRELEDKCVDLFLKYGIKNVEASAYIALSEPLVRYRLKGLELDSKGNITATNRIIGKMSRPEVAEVFLSPPPHRIVDKLLREKKITPEEAELSKKIPMADDICVEADSAGHTDRGVLNVLLPFIIKLRDEVSSRYGYKKKIRVGAAGGIGTPHAAAAAFMLGADFIVTGSLNQCTVEAGTSDLAKDLLQQINVQDTAYAPAGDIFEMGAKVQILKKGLLYPARANKLYDLYCQYKSLNEIDALTQKQLQEKYFKRSFEEIFEDIKAYYFPEEISKAESNPRHKMAMIFKWYIHRSTQWALEGIEERKVDFQIQCGPALGAFNQWVKGTEFENWRNRHVDEIGEKLMKETAMLLSNKSRDWIH